jgi:hypothetical protein
MLSSLDHPSVIKLINDVIEQGNAYCSAVSSSVQTANNGAMFARDAVSLCWFIQEGNEPQWKLKKFLQSMLTTASKAHKQASEVNECFRDVRSMLIDVRHFLI